MDKNYQANPGDKFECTRDFTSSTANYSIRVGELVTVVSIDEETTKAVKFETRYILEFPNGHRANNWNIPDYMFKPYVVALSDEEIKSAVEFPTHDTLKEFLEL